MLKSALSVMLAGLMSAGCHSPVADPGQSAKQDGIVYVNESANRTAIELAVGEVLRVELVGIPTAGYVWEVTELPGTLQVVGEATRATNPEEQEQKGFTGGFHYMSFDLKAVSEGTGALALVEHRPWETEEPPTDTYRLDVTVKPAP